MPHSPKPDTNEVQTAEAVAPAAICSAPSERDKAIWRAALTLAHNMCVQTSNRINDDDGSLEVVHALSDEAKRIRGWMEPTDEQLVEMFTEAGVPNTVVIPRRVRGLEMQGTSSWFDSSKLINFPAR